MAKGPTSLTIFSYQVGFGDCFLLRFVYDDGPRHVLIDFGTTKLPVGAPKDQMVLVAQDIAQKCEKGGLTAVVATHRHADHISGFATRNDGTGSGDIIRKLEPRLVLQPWTEAPDEAVDSLGPVVDSGKRSMVQRLAGLNAMHEVSAKVLGMLEGKSLNRAAPEVRDQLAFLGEDNLSNALAVKNLMTMGEKRVYAYHGSDAGLADLLPGVDTIVLGPPTLHQTETIKKQKSRDPDEYWHLSAAALDSDAALAEEDASLFPDHDAFRASKLPMETRWFAARVDEARSGQLLSLVRSLDQQMNNTSLILLFEVGGKKLLFPGDAQIENWRYALNSEFASKLDGVDLYKVGHHGSLNATPKSMWNRFEKKSSDEEKEGRLKTMLSTMPGKHGHEKDNTEVPRLTLLKALDEQSELHSTHLLAPDALCQEVTIEF